MAATSKRARKNQTTGGKVRRKESHTARKSDRRACEIEKDRVTLSPKTGRLADLAGRFVSFGKQPRTALPVEDMSGAVARAVADEYRRRRASRMTRRGR